MRRAAVHACSSARAVRWPAAEARPIQQAGISDRDRHSPSNAASMSAARASAAAAGAPGSWPTCLTYDVTCRMKPGVQGINLSTAGTAQLLAEATTADRGGSNSSHGCLGDAHPVQQLATEAFLKRGVPGDTGMLAAQMRQRPGARLAVAERFVEDDIGDHALGALFARSTGHRGFHLDRGHLDTGS